MDDDDKWTKESPVTVLKNIAQRADNISTAVLAGWMVGGGGNDHEP